MKQKLRKLLHYSQHKIAGLYQRANALLSPTQKIIFATGLSILCVVAIFGISHYSNSGTQKAGPYQPLKPITKRPRFTQRKETTPPTTNQKTGVATRPPIKAPLPLPTQIPPFAAPKGGSTSTFFGAVDTMKDSRDTDYPVTNQLSSVQIQQEVTLITKQHAGYITDDAFYDYPDYFALWASTIHASGLHVWFRSHFNCWDLVNGCTVQMTPNDYVTALTNFINTNYSVFRPGDIFDPCPEPENSTYWANMYGANWSWQNAPDAGTDAYNNFMLTLSNVAQSDLQSHGVTGVITGIRSTNSWYPQNHEALYLSTIKALGYVTYDSYPEGNTTDPTTAVNNRVSELNAVVADNPNIPIVLGEFGYSNNVNVDDTTQEAVLSAEVNAISPYSQIVGMNYWVGAGGVGYGGYTNIFTGSRGSWSPRPAAGVIAAYFAQKNQ